MDKLRAGLSDWLFAVAVTLYFVMNVAALCIIGIAFHWYIESTYPVVEWNDPDGPGYRVVEVTPDYVRVRWIEMRLMQDCPGRTEVAIIGTGMASHIEAYPLFVTTEIKTFERRYSLPDNIPSGAYEIRITDIIRCNPLFFSRQLLRVPFEIPAR